MKKYLIIFMLPICGLLEMKTVIAQHANVKVYIKKYKSLAINEMARTGVPAAISLAQGIVESGAGTSWLSVHANNQFGIKCKSDWQGQRVFQDDDRRDECFRKYKSAEASWRDHSNFLKKGTRYNFLFYLDPMDYKAWAYGLKQAGYATSNRYARQLIATVQKYKLNKYSKRGLTLSKQEKPQNEFAKLLSKKVQQGQPQQKPEKAASTQMRDKAAAYPTQLFQINKRAVLFLPKGTQLITIANQFDVPLRRIVRYNELKTDVLRQSMLIFIEKKRKKGDHRIHTVLVGETWHQIAQEEGIRLKWLLKRNYATGENPPQAGMILALRGYTEEGKQNQQSGGFFHWLFGLFGGKDKKNSSYSPPAITQKESVREAYPGRSSDTKRNATFVYEVKSGDTLYGISQEFDVSVESIQRINNMNGSLIKVGQKLHIPEK